LIVLRLLRAQPLRALAILALAALSSLVHAQGSSTPLLFEVKSGVNTVYLFGTIHVGARKLYPLPQQVEDAYARSAVLALEADPTDQRGATTAMQLGLYAPPDTLQSHVSAALYEQLDAVLPQVGLPIEYANRVKPFLLSMTIAMLEIQRLGYDPAMGLDVHFAQQAKAQGKPLVELESMQEQIELFAGFSDEIQAGMLQVALDSIADGSMAQELDALMTAWRTGDAEAIYESTRRELEDLPDETANLLYARVYDERNRRMTERIAGFLSGSTVHFVAVGAGHLTGPASLPALLQEKGFSVRRM
jgi:uncharacterized protein YbaP (TraB family)